MIYIIYHSMNATSSAVALQSVQIGGTGFQDPAKSLPGLCCPLLLFWNALCSSSLFTLQAYPSLLSLSPDLHRFARSELVRNVSGLFEEVLTLNHPSKVICEFWKLLLLVSVRCEKSLWP